MIITQVRKGYRNFKLSKKQTFKFCCFLLFVLFSFLFLNQLKNLNYFYIKNIQIAGLKNTNRSEVKYALTPLTQKNFFLVDVVSIKERLMQFSWVSEAYVRRIWPDQIIIKVIEKNPIATWNDLSVLTQSGEVFSPSSNYEINLPVLLGPDGKQLEVLEFYNKLNKLFFTLKLSISKLELTKDLYWRLTLNNNLKLNIGYQDVVTRVSDFVKIYSKSVESNIEDIDYIDLQYGNGFAVRFKH
ncbi:cell division protein FtsQ/DivIB [Gammaproteobacteria bacterium]|nr:cell division protein FtsQ/DivIB [Gammaproteobacteria bacterium]